MPSRLNIAGDNVLPFESKGSIAAPSSAESLPPVLVILHQNASIAGGDEDYPKLVKEWTIDMATKRGGSVRAYRPVPARGTPPPAP